MNSARDAWKSRNRGGVGLRRRWTDYTATVIAVAGTAAVLLPLLAILIYLTRKGAGALNVNFFTHGPVPVGEPGAGMANAIAGSCLLLAMASAIGIPVGIGAGVFLSEYGRSTRLGRAVRFTADILNGTPSIVIGIVMYTIVVLPQRHFSAFSGSLALAVVMVPLITRTTEQMLSTVPSALRDAALGLGISRWRAVVSIGLRTAAPGIVTGCMLAFARVAGETAPLLFTAFGNQFFSVNPAQPVAALPLQIFVYAMSPYDEWHRMAWAGALVLIALIAFAIALVRWFAPRAQKENAW